MIVSTSKIFMADRLEENSYQAPFPKEERCMKCQSRAHPILVVDDDEGLIAQNSPERFDGCPIHPHDSAAFVLYMCDECGEVTTLWNQA